MTNVTIEFSVNGTCTQELKIIDPEYTPERIIDGLNLGDLFTTTWYEAGGNNTGVTDVSGNLVALINYSRIDGDRYDFMDIDASE